MPLQKNCTPEFFIMNRTRPPHNMERRIYSDLNDDKIIYIIDEKTNLRNQTIKTKKKFRFDKVFDIDYTNIDVFKEIAHPMIDNFLSYKNGTFFVYGQTGSGKTHTTLGDNHEIGLFQYILDSIIHSQNNIKNVYFICIQIHNNKCYDLFNSNELINQFEDASGKIHLRNSKRQYLDEINVQETVQFIKNMRMNGISSENDSSSRSHLLIQIWNKNSFFNILDMAGSEKASKSICSNRQQMLENAKINESILALKECIRAVKMAKKYVPYRHNNLTKILKDVFFGNGLSYIMATTSPEKHNVKESINTLTYISDMYTMKRQLSEPTYLKTIRDLHVKHHDSSLKTPPEECKNDDKYYDNSPDNLSHQKETSHYFMKILNNCSIKRKKLFDSFIDRNGIKYNEFKKKMKSLISNEIEQLNEFSNIL
jgi:kinesin family protein 2/24